ncbi:MAG TPA: hypothetical protein VJU58_13685 [Microbacterium sp.]|nr:hypothetical protein [Microbacterium sp.]
MSIDDKLLRDPRAVRLARRFGWRRQEAIGRLLDVYAVAYDREREVLSVEDVDIAAEQDGFADAMFEVDLAEQVRTGVRIKGAAERIAYLAHKSEAGRIGGVKSGESRRNRREAERSSASSTREARGNPPDPVPDLPPDPVPDQKNLSLSGAIPPSTESSPVPSTTPAQSFADRDLARLKATGDLAQAMWTSTSDLRITHARKLKLDSVLPLPKIHPGYHPRAFEELRERIREEGDNARAVCDHILLVLDEQATETKSTEWLSEKAFLSRPWSKARETLLKPKRKPPVAAPASAPTTLTADDRAGAAQVLASFLGKETA